MITIICDTCETKLTVKDENLIGKILACPKCGSMVFVKPPEDVPVPIVTPQKNTVRKRFPDVLSHETSSGIIGNLPLENRRSNLFMETVPAKTDDVSESEIKTRKILLAILIGLALFLLLAIGFLMLFPQPDRAPVPIQPPPHEIPPELPVATDVLTELGGPAVLPPLDEDPPIPPPEVPTEPETTTEPESIGELTSTNGTPTQVLHDTPPAIEYAITHAVEMPLPVVDIDAKLALPILELSFDRQRLIDFVRAMSQLTGVPMTLDIDEMKPLFLTAQTAVSGRFRDATAGEILTETVAALNLQWFAADNQILIFPNVPDGDVDLTFDISDLAEGTDDLTPEVLAERIRKLLVPEYCVEVFPGNRLTVVPHDDDEMVKGKSRRWHRDEIHRFLEQLRLIRQLPPQTELTGEEIAPEAFGWDRVMEPMTFNHYRAIPLPQAVKQLETQTGLTILVDHQSFHRAFCIFSLVQATVQSDNGTVNEVMELLLASADSAPLAYRIIDHQTLEITTAEAVQQPKKMVMEVHPYQLVSGESPEEIVRLLRLAIAPESWVMAELPETKLGGNIVIDVPSNCLLIRQSQPVQRQIRLYLSESALLEP